MTKNKDLKTKYPYLSSNRIDEVKNVFKTLNITNSESYECPEHPSQYFKKASILKSEGIQFSTTSSTI